MTSFTRKELTGIGITLLVVIVLFIGAKWYTTMPSNEIEETDMVVTLPGTESEGGMQELVQSMITGLSSRGEVDQLIIQDLAEGSGAVVENGDTVVVHYIGMLTDRTQFDNSYTRGTPFTFTVGNGEVIEGWDNGVLGMKVGGTRILIVPADQAYGSSGNDVIPANSTLLFAVELLEIQ